MTKCLRTAMAGALALLAACSVDAPGQDQRGQDQRGQDQRERLSASGTVQGYSGGLLYVMTKEGDQYRVKLPAKPEDISYVGSATTSFLSRGMLVKFIAKFDAKGRVVAPVQDITIFTPRKDDKIGIYPDSGLGGGDLFSGVDTSRPEPQGKPYSVAGSITSARGRRLKVAAGRAAVQIELTETARVSVDVSHLQFMQAGDKVTLEGWYYPAQKRDVVANRISISAAETLGAVKKPVADE